MDIIKAGGPSGGLPSGKMTAGLIPSSGMIENTVKGRFMLAGDAAGLSNPITGAGIYNAVLSAGIISRIIVNTLKESDPEMVYRIKDEYKGTFSISLSRATAKRNILLTRWPESIRNGDNFSSLIKETWVAFKSYWRK
jgi:flavin-dependent dehydrogenase